MRRRGGIESFIFKVFFLEMMYLFEAIKVLPPFVGVNCATAATADEDDQSNTPFL